MVFQRVVFWLACIIEGLWIAKRLSDSRDGSVTGLIVTITGISLLLIYLLPIATFGAKIHVGADSLHIEQYSSTVVAYSEITACFGLRLFPWPMVIVLTKRQFPLSILISGDYFASRKRGPFQNGKLAARIKERLTQS